MGKNTTVKAIDFFCSGGGMTFGMTQAGINVIAGIDIDPNCKETYERNNPDSEFILADIFELKESDLEEKMNLKKNDNSLVFIGCSPCQYWSKIRTDKTKAGKSKNLLREFHRFVKYFNPGYVVVENVPGIERNKNESGLETFIDDLGNNGYKVHSEIVNFNEYGVPQSRRRFSLVATRVDNNKIFPKPDKLNKPTVRDFIGERNGFPRIEAGHKDHTEFNHTVSGLSEKNLERLKNTPKNGGSWLDWKNVRQLYRENYRGNEFIDNYGRMSWDKPAPTLTTKFISISNGRFAHPEENRAISLREGATLQTFPKNYIFYTQSILSAARMIGNAVPPEYAKRLGEAIIKGSMKNGK